MKISGDQFVFYTSVLAAVCLFLLWGSEAQACTDHKPTLAKIESKLAKTLYAYYFSRQDADITDSGVELMWKISKDKAHQITIENFSCKEFNLMKVKVLRQLKAKQDRS